MLTALHKEDVGIRPNAVGNVFRRSARKLAVQSVRTRVTAQLRPVHVGFGLAGGAEEAVHVTLKFIINARPHDMMLRIDIRNAFNSLRMDHMLEQSIAACPGTCRLIHCAYSTPVALLIGDEIIASSSGEQQGDPLGSLLFVLAVKDIAQSIGTPDNI